MKKMNRIAALLAAAILALSLAASGGQSGGQSGGGEPQAAAQKKMNDASSMDAVMTMNM